MPITPDPGVLYGYKNPEDSTLDSDGFVGVDPIYQNFANDTDKPDGENLAPEEVESNEDEKSEDDADKKADDKKDETPKAPAKPSTAK